MSTNLELKTLDDIMAPSPSSSSDQDELFVRRGVQPYLFERIPSAKVWERNKWEETDMDYMRRRQHINW